MSRYTERYSGRSTARPSARPIFGQRDGSVDAKGREGKGPHQTTPDHTTPEDLERSPFHHVVTYVTREQRDGMMLRCRISRSRIKNRSIGEGSLADRSRPVGA